MDTLIALLREHGIQATPQRIAVAQFALQTTAHPSADEVWAQVRRRCPTVSRATVYNTLHLLVERGLLRAQVLREGTVVFDPMVEPHHHFVDEETGRIYDVPWDALKVTGHRSLADFDVREHQVVLRGRRRRT
jgi:Fur family transcriptional regulator, iron response regulator